MMFAVAPNSGSSFGLWGWFGASLESSEHVSDRRRQYREFIRVTQNREIERHQEIVVGGFAEGTMKHVDDTEDRVDDKREVFFLDTLASFQLLDVAEELGSEHVSVIDDRE